MMRLAVIPTPAAVDAAWARWRALAIQISCDPSLVTNRNHMEEMARAERDWKEAFLALEE
jgi:hypothetical protein